MKSCYKFEENSLQRFKKIKIRIFYSLNSVLLVIDFCGRMSLLFTGGIMAIKSSAFGRTELSGKDAARFIQHMEEDKKRIEMAKKNIAKAIGDSEFN